MKYYLSNLEHLDKSWMDDERVKKDVGGVYVEEESAYEWFVSLNNTLAYLTVLAFDEIDQFD